MRLLLIFFIGFLGGYLINYYIHEFLDKNR
jgi:hypothetical protein